MDHKEKGFPDGARISALVALLAGASGSVAFMLRAGQRTPRLLLIAMVAWVLAPFAALAWGTAMSRRWPVPVRWTVCVLSLALAAVSAAIYGNVIDIAPQRSASAFRFVITPAASWLLIAVAVATAAVTSRTGSRR